MKKNFSSRGKIDIDLTSLLDIIFLILMVVMCYQSVNTPKQEPVKTEINITTDEYVSAMVLSVGYSDADVKTRNIVLTKKNASEDEKAEVDLQISPENEEDVYLQFKEELTKFIASSTERPVLLILDDSQLLYRDAKKVNEIVEDISKEFTNFYYQGLRTENE